MLPYILIPILKDDETSISGQEMLERANELSIISGRGDADYLLAHQDEIPEEWREYYLVLPDYQDDRRRVAYFFWGGEQWKLGFRWLGNEFFRDDRFLRSREESSGTCSHSLIHTERLFAGKPQPDIKSKYVIESICADCGKFLKVVKVKS